MAVDTAKKRSAALNTWFVVGILPIPNGGGADSVDERAQLTYGFVTANAAAATGVTDMVSPVLVSPIRIVARG